MIINFNKLFVLTTVYSIFFGIVIFPMEKKLQTISARAYLLKDSEIIAIMGMDPLVKIYFKLKNNTQMFFCYFRIHKLMKDSCLLPLYDDPELKKDLSRDSLEFKKKVWDYRLLVSCHEGHYDLANKAITEGANVNAVDYTDNSALFSFKDEAGTVSFWEIFNGISRTKNTLILENKFFAGESTQRLTPIAYAVKSFSVDICELLLKNGAVINDYTFFKKSFEKFKSTISIAQDQMMKAQKNSEIPVFQVDKEATINEKRIIQKIWCDSIFDQSIDIQLFIGKNFIKIIALDGASYKKKYLDFDILAIIYASLLLLNEKDGTRIAHLYRHWKDYKFFKDLVFKYIKNYLQKSSYAYHPSILSSNFIILMKNILHYSSKYSLNDEQFVKFLFNYFFVLADYQEQWKKHCSVLQEILLENPQGRFFLKQLCQENKTLFCPTIKIEIQKHLLQNYLMAIFSHRNSPFSFDIAGKIAKFWQPDKEFIEWIKALKNNQKKDGKDCLVERFEAITL